MGKGGDDGGGAKITEQYQISLVVQDVMCGYVLLFLLDIKIENR